MTSLPPRKLGDHVPRAWDVVLVTFEFLDRTGSKLRPALVLSQSTYNTRWRRFIFAPITGSAGAVEGTVEIQDLAAAGLNTRSYCHGVIWTTENKEIKRTIGQLSAPDVARIRQLIRDTLSL